MNHSLNMARDLCTQRIDTQHFVLYKSFGSMLRPLEKWCIAIAKVLTFAADVTNSKSTRISLLKLYLHSDRGLKPKNNYARVLSTNLRDDVYCIFQILLRLVSDY